MKLYENVSFALFAEGEGKDEEFPSLSISQPDMLQHDHEFGITPRYIKIILSPLPEYEQNYAEELVRIQEMYRQ